MAGKGISARRLSGAVPKMGTSNVSSMPLRRRLSYRLMNSRLAEVWGNKVDKMGESGAGPMGRRADIGIARL